MGSKLFHRRNPYIFKKAEKIGKNHSNEIYYHIKGLGTSWFDAGNYEKFIDVKRSLGIYLLFPKSAAMKYSTQPIDTPIGATNDNDKDHTSKLIDSKI